MKTWKTLLYMLSMVPMMLHGQINTAGVLNTGKKSLYVGNYLLSIQYFNEVIEANPDSYEPYFYRALAKMQLQDYVGAENDCDQSIQRNPFVVGTYQIRGLVKIKQHKYKEAIEDYSFGIKHDPTNATFWHNLTLCQLKEGDYAMAEASLEKYIQLSPKALKSLLIKAEIALQKGDTCNAYNYYNQVIEQDKSNYNAWALRGALFLRQKKYERAEDDLNHAIALRNNQPAAYVNRALSRYYRDDLKGALNDYDAAIKIDPNNYTARYNRGLLRSRVGDENRALEDLNFVIARTPNDMIALFNRGLSRAKTGNLKGALNDFTEVLTVHPHFTLGYHHRAEIKRKLGDITGAKQDDAMATGIQMRRISLSTTPASVAKPGNNTDESASHHDDMMLYKRILFPERSDMDIKDGNDAYELTGNSSSEVNFSPLFTFTYYPNEEGEAQSHTYYHRSIDELNRRKLLPEKLFVTHTETSLTLAQIKKIMSGKEEPETEEGGGYVHFSKGMNFYLLQDYAKALEEFTRTVNVERSFFPAYFMRAITHFKQIDFYRASQSSLIGADNNGMLNKEEEAVLKSDYDVVIKDLSAAISLSPDFTYAYFNRGCIYALQGEYAAAIDDFNKAISLHPKLGEAYYNMGLVNIYIGQHKAGLSNLSKAGEFGMLSAYDVIKQIVDAI